ncbi:hypothetical protein K435DRAFT_802306 [Dendrothele bispora CBS 962.96]|uniref:CxC2-like cysteine cluster KDZ transposase-associated domain-containing protein n=1 Tax=Dendrothele bispora (strain CBS 962.96) TaxID=1314807 RepID=A0A4S8LLA6_DENBC|nr:hypothetical protein K435DRAFT_802306 [Dendrothele bispora CBS 962.96]
MSNAVASPNNGQQEAQDTTNRAGLLRGEGSAVDLRKRLPSLTSNTEANGSFLVSREDLYTPATLTNVEIGSMSTDTRRLNKNDISLERTSPQKKRQRELARLGQEQGLAELVHSMDCPFEWEGRYSLDDGTGWKDQANEDRDDFENKVVVVKRRYLSSDEPMLLWRPLRNEYLAEFVRGEGRGDYYNEVCPRCYETDSRHQPLYRCMDCFSPELAHMDRPLDIIKKWNGKFFEPVFLRDIGLRIQLGHARGEECQHPRRGNIGFLVIHTNGIHPVSVDYCDCPGRNVSFRQQCMRHRWFPATQEDPQTCATFRVLDLFHRLTLHGKSNVYDFMNGLEKLTNNGGITYQKRGGRGNDLDGRTVEDTKPGELAVECIACPRPGINLPDDWESASPEKRLKRRLVSSEAKDPGLGTGWSYFVEDSPFRAYIKTVKAQTEMSTCSGLAALDYANTRYSRGYRATGVAIGVCARHEIVQRTGAVDLQKGERCRYANMDYAYGSILCHVHPHLHCVNSYDIVCQWHKHLAKRMESMPELVRVDVPARTMDYVIPKLHIHGHNLNCQLNFSLNYTPGVGRTDGKMGPGTRHDTLDDHLHHWNWMKTIALGKILWKRLHNAVAERNAQRRSLEEFTEQQGDNAGKWIKMVRDWEKGQKDFNPFELKQLGMTEHKVRLTLAEKEQEDANAGVPSIHHVTPSAFISHGLKLEEQQRRLAQDVKNNAHTTAKQLTTIIERRTRLSRAIGRFRAIQATYTPAALQALSKRQVNSPGKADNSVLDENPESIPLMLPSSLSPAEREQGCRTGLLGIELQLRDAQMRRSLEHLRNHLHIRSRLVTYRDSNVRHQSMLTRSRAMLARNDMKTETHKQRYQAAWLAVARAHGGDKTKVKWMQLRDADVRCLSSEADLAWKSARKVLGKKRRKEMEEEMRLNKELTAAADDAEVTREEVRDRSGHGYQKTSWIWMQGGTGEMIDEERMRDGIRVEYCKAYARTQRWTEEVLLVREEMRRSLVSLEAKARWWEKRTEAPANDDIHAEGVAAYAHSQAAVMRALLTRFIRVWKGYETLEEVEEEEEVEGSSELLKGGEGDADGRDALDEEEQEDEEEDDGLFAERELDLD